MLKEWEKETKQNKDKIWKTRPNKRRRMVLKYEFKNKFINNRYRLYNV